MSAAVPSITQSKGNNSPAAPMSFNATPTAATDLGWMGSLRDLPREHGFELLRMEGTLPGELNGTLYRAGPSLFSSFGKPYGHLFDGDGAVSAVRFANGSTLGAAKLVQSEGLLKERSAGHQLFGGYGTNMPGLKRFLPLPLTSKVKNTANTSILVWGERVFALNESGMPTEIAPSDLATLGEQDLGMVVQSFSAHPHRVPSRRAIFNFGLRYGRKIILDVYELADSGRGREAPRILCPAPEVQPAEPAVRPQYTQRCDALEARTGHGCDRRADRRPPARDALHHRCVLPVALPQRVRARQ